MRRDRRLIRNRRSVGYRAIRRNIEERSFGSEENGHAAAGRAAESEQLAFAREPKNKAARAALGTTGKGAR